MTEAIRQANALRQALATAPRLSCGWKTNPEGKTSPATGTAPLTNWGRASKIPEVRSESSSQVTSTLDTPSATTRPSAARRDPTQLPLYALYSLSLGLLRRRRTRAREGPGLPAKCHNGTTRGRGRTEQNGHYRTKMRQLHDLRRRIGREWAQLRRIRGESCQYGRPTSGIAAIDVTSRGCCACVIMATPAAGQGYRGKANPAGRVPVGAPSRPLGRLGPRYGARDTTWAPRTQPRGVYEAWWLTGEHGGDAGVPGGGGRVKLPRPRPLERARGRLSARYSG